MKIKKTISIAAVTIFLFETASLAGVPRLIISGFDQSPYGSSYELATEIRAGNNAEAVVIKFYPKPYKPDKMDLSIIGLESNADQMHEVFLESLGLSESSSLNERRGISVLWGQKELGIIIDLCLTIAQLKVVLNRICSGYVGKNQEKQTSEDLLAKIVEYGYSNFDSFSTEL